MSAVPPPTAAARRRQRGRDGTKFGASLQLPRPPRRVAAAFVAATVLCWSCGAGAGETVLVASHQWPAKMGDLRDEMLQMVADEVARAGVGLRIDVYPNASRVAAKEQWAALGDGRVDITLLPLDYASDRHPEFSVTLMPMLVRDYEHAKRLSASPFMIEIERIIAGDGIFVLADGWLSGGFASRRSCILRPTDVSGARIRTAGPMFEAMLAGAGASLLAIGLAEVPAAMASGKLDAAVTSSESLVSTRLYEHSACVTPPGDAAIWFMYEPILMARRAFDRLSRPQRDALLAAARKAEAFGYERAAYSDEVLVGLFTLRGVRVAMMTPADTAEWRALAERTAYRLFAERVPGGRALLDMALAVP